MEILQVVDLLFQLVNSSMLRVNITPHLQKEILLAVLPLRRRRKTFESAESFLTALVMRPTMHGVKLATWDFCCNSFRISFIVSGSMFVACQISSVIWFYYFR